MTRQRFRTTASYARPDAPARAPQHEADVRVPLEQALVASGAFAVMVAVLVLVISAALTDRDNVSFWRLASISTQVAVSVFVVSDAVLLGWYVLEQWLARSRELRDVGAGLKPAQEGRPARDSKPAPIAFQAHARTETGRLQLGLFEIDTPAAGELMLARWFWRVARQNGIGFSIHIADNYHITREECADIQQAFIDAGHAKAHYRSDGQLSRVDLNADGLQALWEFVWQHFPHARPKKAPLPQGSVRGS